jgi:hypothetical protein
MDHKYLEVVRARRQELIAHVQRLRRRDAAKVPLAGAHAPGFVANIDKDVVAT